MPKKNGSSTVANLGYKAECDRGTESKPSALSQITCVWDCVPARAGIATLGPCAIYNVSSRL